MNDVFRAVQRIYSFFHGLSSALKKAEFLSCLVRKYFNYYKEIIKLRSAVSLLSSTLLSVSKSDNLMLLETV